MTPNSYVQAQLAVERRMLKSALQRTLEAEEKAERYARLVRHLAAEVHALSEAMRVVDEARGLE
jgi:hypothetical protein